MADTKISALPASTTPLAGTEVLPIVQSSSTKQVSVANLTAGRAISATSVTASTGNFVVGTSGQGIDFSATPGTGTSELLDDYETGTFTPVVNFGGASTGVTYTSRAGRYTKVGNRVSVDIYIVLSSKGSSAGDVTFDTLPFTSAATPPSAVTFGRFENMTYTGQFNGRVNFSSTSIELFQTSALGVISGLNNTNFANTTICIASVSYTSV